MARFHTTKQDLTDHFESLMHATAFDMNTNVELLLEELDARPNFHKNGVFDYRKHFVDFFKYMAEHCSDKNTEYTRTDYLRKKIDEFGEIFRKDYIVTFDKTNKPNLKKFTLNERDEKSIELKKKYCGNLLEIISGLFIIDFELKDFEGIEFESWCNNTEDDWRGVDGIMTSTLNDKIRIPMNTKHSKFDEIGKFVPFQKLGDWFLNELEKNENDSEIQLEMLKLKYRGIIFTDNDVTEFASSKFPKIYIVNGVELCKKLGKAGNNYGFVNVWKHWYDLVK